jgi:hypothetical protein
VYRTSQTLVTTFFGVLAVLTAIAGLEQDYHSELARDTVIVCVLGVIAIFIRWVYAGVWVGRRSVRVVNALRTVRIPRWDVVRLELQPSRLALDQLNGVLITASNRNVRVLRINATPARNPGSVQEAQEVLLALGHDLGVPVTAPPIASGPDDHARV